jgi:hypothetical protein
MRNSRVVESWLISRTALFGLALACTAAGAANLESGTAPSARNGPVYVAQASATQNDNFRKAMELLQRSDAAKPSREDVERAGHMLMDAGPDAFEKAMNLLRRPDVKSTDVAAAKQQMMKGGPDASDKAMKLLRGTFGY